MWRRRRGGAGRDWAAWAGRSQATLASLYMSPTRLPLPLPARSNRPQETPPAIEDMLSWNTLTPHYEEDVIYALNSASVARHFGMEPASAQVGGAAGVGLVELSLMALMTPLPTMHAVGPQCLTGSDAVPGHPPHCRTHLPTCFYAPAACRACRT